MYTKYIKRMKVLKMTTISNYYKSSKPALGSIPYFFSIFTSIRLIQEVILYINWIDDVL